MAYLIFITLCLLTLIGAGRKWELKSAYYIPWAIVMAAAGSGAIFGVQNSDIALPMFVLVPLGLMSVYLLSAVVILCFFFRDPQRQSPQTPGVIVSPADGRIVYVKQIDGGAFPFAVKKSNKIPLSDFSEVELIPDRGVQIGIAMNFMDVHVNRSPIAGNVEMVRRIPGRFASLKHIASLLENERVLMVIQGEGIRLGLVQIASRLVRRIVPYVAEGENVQRGQRVGMIRFGSQVDVLLPDIEGLAVCVSEGDELTAGETLIATWDVSQRQQRDTQAYQPQTVAAP